MCLLLWVVQTLHLTFDGYFNPEGENRHNRVNWTESFWLQTNRQTKWHAVTVTVIVTRIFRIFRAFWIYFFWVPSTILSTRRKTLNQFIVYCVAFTIHKYNKSQMMIDFLPSLLWGCVWTDGHTHLHIYTPHTEYRWWMEDQSEMNIWKDKSVCKVWLNSSI